VFGLQLSARHSGAHRNVTTIVSGCVSSRACARRAEKLLMLAAKVQHRLGLHRRLRCRVPVRVYAIAKRCRRRRCIEIVAD